MSLQGREILLGVTGGVSAYKSAELLRRLQDLGLQITVIPTKNSLNFVGKATWEALSGRKVHSELWENIDSVDHISLAKNSQAIVIAPTTANFIAKLANGVADDLLSTVVLASTAPKILIPAMHPEMWTNQITVENIKKLKSAGFHIIDPEFGKMTGEDVGVGRYPEINGLLEQISKILHLHSDYSGRKVVITAGGTREYLDPVRFIGNKSSGKQGVAIAQAAKNRGAKVVLIGANVNISIPSGIEFISVESAEQMLEACKNSIFSADLLVMAAAVADVKPKNATKEKIKKSALTEIKLAQNPDILKELASIESAPIIKIGFAAETLEDLKMEAKAKLESKSLDFIYVNNVSNGEIFGKDSTKGFILSKEGHIEEFAEGSKGTLANRLLDLALDKLG